MIIKVIQANGAMIKVEKSVFIFLNVCNRYVLFFE